jgi:hypothetical protein
MNAKASRIGNAIVNNKDSTRPAIWFKGEKRAKSVAINTGRACNEKEHRN